MMAAESGFNQRHGDVGYVSRRNGGTDTDRRVMAEPDSGPTAYFGAADTNQRVVTEPDPPPIGPKWARAGCIRPLPTRTIDTQSG
jgi:hypothetical protein